MAQELFFDIFFILMPLSHNTTASIHHTLSLFQGKSEWKAPFSCEKLNISTEHGFFLLAYLKQEAQGLQAFAFLS